MTTLTFDGDLDAESAAAVVSAIDDVNSSDSALVLNMRDVEVLEGRACAALVDAIRRAVRRLGDVVVVEGPQVLNHTLYRVGALESGCIRLVEPRDEIGGAG